MHLRQRAATGGVEPRIGLTKIDDGLRCSLAEPTGALAAGRRASKCPDSITRCSGPNCACSRIDVAARAVVVHLCAVRVCGLVLGSHQTGDQIRKAIRRRHRKDHDRRGEGRALLYSDAPERENRGIRMNDILLDRQPTNTSQR
jgi:hypothetical protein